MAIQAGERVVAGSVRDTDGRTVVVLANNAGTQVGVQSPADGAAAQAALPTFTQPELFNGSTWDRQRANLDTAALITGTGAVAGANSVDVINYNGRGVKVGINISAIAGTTPTLTVTLQGKDVASGQYYNLLVSPALAAVAFSTLTLYPGIAAVANVSANDVLPRTFRVITAIAGTTPTVSYTVGASIIL